MIESLLVQLICTRQTSARSKLISQLGVLGALQQIRNNCVLIQSYRKNLTLTVDTNDTSRFAISTGCEDGLTGDAVHENAGTGLEVVQMNEAILGDDVNDLVTIRDLHCDWEVVGGLGWEIDVDVLLGELRVSLLVIHLDNVELCASCGSVDKREELRVGWRSLLSDFTKGSSVSFDALADAAILGIKLHVTNDTTLLL